jgi:hypothetical protein
MRSCADVITGENVVVDIVPPAQLPQRCVVSGRGLGPSRGGNNRGCRRGAAGSTSRARQCGAATLQATPNAFRGEPPSDSNYATAPATAPIRPLARPRAMPPGAPPPYPLESLDSAALTGLATAFCLPAVSEDAQGRADDDRRRVIPVMKASRAAGRSFGVRRIPPPGTGVTPWTVLLLSPPRGVDGSRIWRLCANWHA